MCEEKGGKRGSSRIFRARRHSSILILNNNNINTRVRPRVPHCCFRKSDDIRSLIVCAGNGIGSICEDVRKSDGVCILDAVLSRRMSAFSGALNSDSATSSLHVLENRVLQSCIS